jgi:hypothetical protein
MLAAACCVIDAELAHGSGLGAGFGLLQNIVVAWCGTAIVHRYIGVET